MKPSIRRILVPVDFSEESKHAFEYARWLAAQFGSTVDLLHVVSLPPFMGTELLLAGPGREQKALDKWIREQVGEQMEEFVPAGIEVERRFVIGSAAEGIVDTAKSEGYDLIVMGTHGRTGLGHLLLGSVAQRVLQHAPCPVLTVK
jgi:universal stress protein A